jgi:hypothetical protein
MCLVPYSDHRPHHRWYDNNIDPHWRTSSSPATPCRSPMPPIPRSPYYRSPIHRPTLRPWMHRSLYQNQPPYTSPRYPSPHWTPRWTPWSLDVHGTNIPVTRNLGPHLGTPDTSKFSQPYCIGNGPSPLGGQPGSLFACVPFFTCTLHMACSPRCWSSCLFSLSHPRTSPTPFPFLRTYALRAHGPDSCQHPIHPPQRLRRHQAGHQTNTN